VRSRFEPWPLHQFHPLPAKPLRVIRQDRQDQQEVSSAFPDEKQKSLIDEKRDAIGAMEASPITRHRHFL